MAIHVLIPGVLTTIQDLGRFGYQKSGMTCSGVMDQAAYRKANYLVGNSEDAAVLELTLYGGCYEFTEDAIIALTGADMAPDIDGNLIENSKPIAVKAGETLNLKMANTGCRTYLGVAGGFDVPKVMGSYSTNMKCSIGGYGGRKLKSGDVLKMGQTFETMETLKNRKVTTAEYPKKVTVHVIPGPQEEYFTPKGLSTFYDTAYTVSDDCDRMGYRLEGAQVESKKGTDIVSDGIVFGSIQVPASGKPIILMADHQTTGGYAKIGTVCQMDLSAIAQCKPGDSICFKKISVEDAQELYEMAKKSECH